MAPKPKLYLFLAPLSKMTILWKKNPYRQNRFRIDQIHCTITIISNHITINHVLRDYTILATMPKSYLFLAPKQKKKNHTYFSLIILPIMVYFTQSLSTLSTKIPSIFRYQHLMPNLTGFLASMSELPILAKSEI